MQRIIRVALGLTAALAVVVVGAVGAGRLVFDRRVAGEVAEMFTRAGSARAGIVQADELAGLPEPVRRWLHRAGVVGTERPVTVRLKMAGHFRMKPDGPWLPLAAEQYYSTDPPAFVWAAQMAMAPLISVSIRDCYADGHGQIDGRLLALLPVAQASGPDLDQGALLHYLNETMWFPAAVLSPYITWESIDATSAKATMRYGDVVASATFVFNEQGDLVDMLALRYQEASNSYQPWATPISEYGEFNGIRIPVAGEAAWQTSSGDFAYIRSRITAIEYNRPARW